MPNLFGSERLRGMLSTLCVAVLLSACSSSKLQQKRYDVEFISLESTRLEDVMAAPTTFILPYSDVPAAWSRAQLFFDRYSENGAQEQDSQDGTVLSSRPGPTERYLFAIERQPHEDGAKFQVRCVALSEPATADLARRNAHNLARFLRDGTLELSLLSQ